MVYVLIVRFPYEGAYVLGVYSSRAKAEGSKVEWAKDDNNNGYTEYDIEEFDIE